MVADHIRVLPSACDPAGAIEARLHLNLEGGEYGMENDVETTQRAACADLKQVLRDVRPSLLKIDCEGGEYGM